MVAYANVYANNSRISTLGAWDGKILQVQVQPGQFSDLERPSCLKIFKKF